MSISFGFYNSSNHDRRYDARQISRLFNALIKDGVFMHIGSHFAVTEGSGMTVNVGTGYAWFNSTWTLNDSPFPITPEESDLLLTRIDAVVLEINETVNSRTNSIKFVKGTPSANPQKPALTNTNDVHQYALAYVTIAPGAESLSQANIENNVGMESCPFVTGILETVDISSLIAQWETQWNEWLNQQKKETDDFQETSEEKFNAWFENVKGQLGTDPAGNLQSQIDQIKATEAKVYKATFLMDSWQNSGSEYTQNVSAQSVDGTGSITENSKWDSPIYVEQTNNFETNEKLVEALSILNIGEILFGEGTISCRVSEKPTCDIEIFFKAIG